MCNRNLTPPKIAKLLLNTLLPAHIKDEISGDLEEEFHQLIKTTGDNVLANRWFWHQSLTTCLRYLFTVQRLLSVITIIVAFSLLGILYIAITSLSYANADFFENEYWYNGMVHLLFFESKFWFFAATTDFYRMPVSLLVDTYSGVWSILALFTLYKLDKKLQFNVLSFFLLSLGLMLTPYLSGVVTFQIATLDDKEVGPLIAFMWLPIMYMILPITYSVVSKLNQHKNENSIAS